MKVSFEHSHDYDQMLATMLGIDFDPLKTREYLLTFQLEWSQREEKIIQLIEKASRLKFKNKVKCFIVQSMSYKAISHPLTISSSEDTEKNIHLLIHELIHVLFVQNQTKELLLKLEENYPDREKMVHLPVLLVQKRVEDELFGRGSFSKNVDGLESFLPVVSRIYPKYVKQRKNVLEFLLK
jgi:hypothetical protein